MAQGIDSTVEPVGPQGAPSGSPSRPSHREAKKEECRRAIARAALVVLEAKGVEDTTKDEIARAAGVSRPTVFNYFAHKEDILPEAIGTLMRDRAANAFPGGLAEALADPVESLRKILVSNATVFQEYPKTGRAFHVLKMQEASARWGERPHVGSLDACLPADLEALQGKLDPALLEGITWIDGLIRRAQDMGKFRADFAPADIRFHLMIGLFASTMGPWTRGFYGTEDLAAIVSRHFDLYVGGLRA